jgi:carbonic anhydrase
VGRKASLNTARKVIEQRASLMNDPVRWNRRRWLARAGAIATAITAAEAFAQSPTVGAASAEAPPADAAEGLARLKAGNERFTAGRTRHAHTGADWRKHLVGGQKPFATLLGCADSRVPVELVFDQGFGDLFVVRVAGNVIAPDVVGSLEYAVEHLATPLLVIVGHESCGAVTAAVQALSGKSDALSSVNNLARMIEPGLPKDLHTTPEERRVAVAVEANVRWSLKQLAALPEIAKTLALGRIQLAGAVYELGTGRVRFLDT